MRRWKRRMEGAKVRMMQEAMVAVVMVAEKRERARLRARWEGGQGQQCKGEMTREEVRGRRRRRGR